MSKNNCTTELREIKDSSLKGIISQLRKAGAKPDDSTRIFKRLRGTDSDWIPLLKQQYAFNNKYFDLSKSTDGTGFYYVWEWEKKSPFDQNSLPLNGFVVTAQDRPYVVDVIPTKTKWQKFKSFLSKLFN